MLPSILMEGGTAHGVTGGKEEFLISDGHSTFPLTIEKSLPLLLGNEIFESDDTLALRQSHCNCISESARGESTLTTVYFPRCNDRDVILSKLSEIQHLFSCTNTKEDASLVLQLNTQDRVYFSRGPASQRSCQWAV